MEGPESQRADALSVRLSLAEFYFFCALLRIMHRP
jgi:hypothetical protein